MNFLSDNLLGASPAILEAIVACNPGEARPYGEDQWSKRAQAKVSEIFEQEVEIFSVASGTAANALALAAIAPPGSAVLCHDDAHVMTSECGAPEFFTGACKLVGVRGDGGKIDAHALTSKIDQLSRGNARQARPAALSLSQATEAGTVYSPQEIKALTDLARDRGLLVHMDGARFANAVAHAGAKPAEMTWRAGVDVLSLGATKNGAIACETVVFFNREAAANFLSRRKRAGQTLAKARFAGAQLEAYLTDDHWIGLAQKANASATYLARSLQDAVNVRLPYPTQANIVFAVIPRIMDQLLRSAGAHYLEWEGSILPEEQRPNQDEVLIRLVCSYATSPADIDAFSKLVHHSS